MSYVPNCCGKPMEDRTTQDGTGTWGEAEFICSACQKTVHIPFTELEKLNKMASMFSWLD